MMCKGSSFGGACAAGFQCDGDAVFCAIAQDQHIRNCTFFDTATPLSDLGNQVAAGNDPQKSSFPDPLHPTTFAIASLDQSEMFGAACLPSQTIVLQGHAITIDTTWFCQYAALMGTVWVVACLMGAAMIIGRG